MRAKNSGKDHMRKPCTTKDAPRGAASDLAKNSYKPKNADKTVFYSSVEAKAMPAPTSKKPLVLTANGEVHTNE